MNNCFLPRVPIPVASDVHMATAPLGTNVLLDAEGTLDRDLRHRTDKPVNDVAHDVRLIGHGPTQQG